MKAKIINVKKISIKKVVKQNWSPFKEILFGYLAMSKILYWIDFIFTMDQSELSSMRENILMRLVNRDLLIIIGVIAFFYLEKRIERIELKKSKYSKILEFILYHVIGYVVLLGIIFIYFMVYLIVREWLGLEQSLSLGEYAIAFLGIIPNYTIGYPLAAVALEIKYRLKQKKKVSSEDLLSVHSTEDKLTMLKILLDDCILTQEEFDYKKDFLLSV